jgi:hypothetical protein
LLSITLVVIATEVGTAQCFIWMLALRNKRWHFDPEACGAGFFFVVFLVVFFVAIY